MRPQKGDSVKLTNEFVNMTSIKWVPALKGLKLSVVKLELKALTGNEIYKVFFVTPGNTMYSLNINKFGNRVTDTGLDTETIVFENYDADFNFDEPTPVMSKGPINLEDYNSVCTKCGHRAVDLLFKVVCSNPQCKDYKG